MRLHRLEVEGFGPFRARQTVDFDAFADDGIFLIAGRTGAGKSSILDAVCFGLYGGVPRYDGGEKRLRSDHCEAEDLSEVVVEFSTPAGRFRVTRSPEYLRPAKRGGGLTKQAAAVALDELTESGWIGRAARAVDVATELEGILQLSREQFLQVILLAQNRFSEFLLAGSRDRQALLRRLFGTQRFEDVQTRFDERRREREQAHGVRLAAVDARIDEAERLARTADLTGESGEESPHASESETGLPQPRVTVDERIEVLRRADARAAYQVERKKAEQEAAEQQSTEADAELAAARENERAQRERDRARSALDRLEEEAPLIEAAKAELEAAHAAELLRSLITAAVRARTALTSAVEHEKSVRESWKAFGIAVGGELESWAEERTRESGAWERAREWEKQAPHREAELQKAENSLSLVAARIESGETERDSLPAAMAALTAERDDSRRLADRKNDLDAAQQTADGRRRAAHEIERLRVAEASAERQLSESSAVHAAAQSALAQLRQRRIDGMAGELASALQPDHSCPVCGSLEHPAPAAHSDPVSPEDIAEAESARDSAAQNERDCASTCAALTAELAASAAVAGQRSVDQAESEYAEAVEAYEQSLAAAKRCAELDQQLSELSARAERLEAERAADVAALAQAREEHAVLSQRNKDAHDLIADARGEFDSVSSRLADNATKIAAARAVVEAEADRARKAEVLAETEAERDAALASSLFDDVTAAEQALRSASARDALAERIKKHGVEWSKEREILLALELRILPEDPIDLAPIEEAAAAARTMWQAAVAAASRAAATADRLRELIDSAATEHEKTAEDAAELEVLQGLADTIAGRGANSRKMALETFVLAAELEEIVEAANRRLHDMSTGRYQLQHSDALAARGAASGLGIVVFDAFTGQARPPQSLSGGETFLTSLALALGLAEVVTARAGGIRLDTLFIDEGFGSLDGDTLDVAMATLDELRQGGRTVGIISHVEAMQEQIPAQLTVRALSNGPSVISAR